MGDQELLVYWRVIKRRWWLIATLVGVTVGAILLSFFLSPPLYRASVLFAVTSPPPASVSLFSEFRTSTTRDELNYTRNNFLAVLKSPFVAGQVVDELGLGIDPEEILNQTAIEPDTASDSVRVSVTANDPKLAADIAFALVNRASQYFAELNAGSITVNKEFIQAQLQATKKELDQARAAMIDFQIKNRIGSLTGLLRSQEDLITASKANRDRALAEGNKAIATSYESIIAAREQELQEQIALSSQNEDLQGAVHRIDSTYTSLLSKESEVKLKENELLNARFIQIIPASAPGRPLPRINPTILLLGIVVSLAVGIVLAFLLQYLEGVGREGLAPVTVSHSEPAG
jgi:succinoglycan biosynthesis transport protein ExoP